MCYSAVLYCLDASRVYNMTLDCWGGALRREQGYMPDVCQTALERSYANKNYRFALQRDRAAQNLLVDVVRAPTRMWLGAQRQGAGKIQYGFSRAYNASVLDFFCSLFL